MRDSIPIVKNIINAVHRISNFRQNENTIDAWVVWWTKLSLSPGAPLRISPHFLPAYPQLKVSIRKHPNGLNLLLAREERRNWCYVAHRIGERHSHSVAVNFGRDRRELPKRYRRQ
jgi:hypothetical protein